MTWSARHWSEIAAWLPPACAMNDHLRSKRLAGRYQLVRPVVHLVPTAHHGQTLRTPVGPTDSSGPSRRHTDARLHLQGMTALSERQSIDYVFRNIRVTGYGLS